MPPAYSNRTLTQEQIAVLERWIREGGEYSKHWAFIPPVKTSVPVVSDRTWMKQPIDAFVSRRLESEGLHPSPPAAPETWLRRVSLDLTGLPPAVADLNFFLADSSRRGEAAYNAAVDRLLASPAYGERMAVDWLDVARYADTHGFNNDAERIMWRWRDWVIESFNANLPYNRFITEQLAGDLLPNPTLEQRIATGFGRNHVINSEGGIIDEEYRVEYVADRVRTLGMAWLGLTVECARCHDHKYDPVTQRDYYRLYAFFNNVPELGEDGRVANAVPMIPAPTRNQQAELEKLRSAVSAFSREIELREKVWSWSNDSADTALQIATRLKVPENPTLHIRCDSPQSSENFQLASGVVGSSCTASAEMEKIQTRSVPISKRRPLTFTLWIRPAREGMDAPLLSAINYSENPVASTFGRGLELRLINGELEFRLSDRFPAYSVRIRSEGAAIEPGQWRHVALAYEGAGTRNDVMRVRASWVRIFIDGREVATRVLNDGAMLPSARGDKASPTRFRIGWDNSPNGETYKGQLDEIAFWSRALNPDEIAGLFESQALPYSVDRQRERRASHMEQRWVCQMLLRAEDDRYAETYNQWSEARASLFALERGIPTTMVMQEMDPPRQTHVLTRGAYNAPAEKVEPGVPEVLLAPWPAGAPKNRLGLAAWLTQPDNPLTGRVVVNRFWQQLFGQGLVATSDNFGLQGDSPTHPELLDWLTVEFIESGWNVKALLKQIVLSATYRQSSNTTPALLARDPQNRLLARGPRFRLPAEVIRDQALFVSGLLKQRVGGPSVFPQQPADLYKGIVVAADYPGTTWPTGKGDDLHRRSLYTFWKRTVPHPAMTVFDAPDREFCIVRRSTTNTPLQALTLLNDPIFIEAARSLAERAIQEGGSTSATRLAFAFRAATGRVPEGDELAVLVAKFEEMLTAYRTDQDGARALISVGAAIRDNSVAVSERAAYTAVANLILNLDEVITKG
jgi:hypothetical protein